MKSPIRALFLLAALAAGCDGSSSGPPTLERGEENRLGQVGEVLRNFQLAKGKPPKNMKELRANPGDSGGADLVLSGSVVVIWNVPLPDTKEEPGGSPNEEVLAYGKDVPTQGGPVLLLNRTVRRMTADEFKAAPQAKPGP
ncbi:MAG: hypothetical protein BGO49_17145 [Planctomycetales bacterium 71-10]|nr:MAG: hypothetical protein BGO49_17145 [Planctomycetales bacterium 71-10]